MITILFCLLCVFPFADDQAKSVSTTTPAKLESALSEIDITHHWKAGAHVDWMTGDPDGLPVSTTGRHTHCSAFVASVCKRMNVPLLSPPQHPQEFLADAQYDWLVSDVGVSAGWQPIENATEADRMSRDQYVVLAVYHSPDERQPGHIAIVIPSSRSAEQIKADGPDITQAGVTNYSRTTLRIGFKHHPLAWEQAKQVRFFAHRL